MTEKINGQQNYEKTNKEPNFKLRQRLVGGAALALVGGIVAGGVAFYEGGISRSNKQLEIEQGPSLEDQIFDAIENYNSNDPQVKYEIIEDSNISQQAEVAAKILHESDENLTYAENHQALALTATGMAARDIEAITGRTVQAGDQVTTWYDVDLGSFVTAATEALPSED